MRLLLQRRAPDVRPVDSDGCGGACLAWRSLSPRLVISLVLYMSHYAYARIQSTETASDRLLTPRPVIDASSFTFGQNVRAHLPLPHIQALFTQQAKCMMKT